MDQSFNKGTLSHPEAAALVHKIRQARLDKADRQPATARLTDNVTGKEVVTRSSIKPIIVRPPLEVTPKELSDHRSDTHRRVAYWVSDKIAYATGSIDGVVDGAANGIAELEEDVAFLLSKMVSGAVHGWEKGKISHRSGSRSVNQHQNDFGR